MLIDGLYSWTYFQYTYFLELKRRYMLVGRELHLEYRLLLNREIKKENGKLRNFIQSAYIPWYVFCILANLWYLPIIITVFTGVMNLIYRKPYISPFILMLNLLIMNCCFAYGILSLFLVK